MNALSSFLSISILGFASILSVAHAQDHSKISDITPALSKALEQGATRTCIPLTLTFQGVSERDDKPFFFSTSVPAMPEIIKKVSRNNKFSNQQQQGFSRIYKTAQLAQKQGTGFSEQSLVHVAEQSKLKIQTQLVCLESYTLTIDP